MKFFLKRPRGKHLRSALLIFATALLAGVVAVAVPNKWLSARTHPGPSAEELAAIEQGYVCPMHPEITSDHPDNCPICGMALVKANGQGHHHELHVDSAALASLGVRLVAVERKEIAREVRSYGTVVPAEDVQFAVTSKFDGWLRKLNVHAVGEHVERGQVLYEIYSPDLVAKEREFFQFLVRRKQILQSVGDVSQQENEYVMDLLQEWQKQREDLMRLDLDIETVQKLEQDRTPIEVIQVHAPRSGVITQLNVREGSFVSPAAPILTIADPSTVWIDVVLAAGEAELVAVGDPVSIGVTGTEPLQAKIDFLNPLLDTGRARARIALHRPAADLHLGALVNVTIRSSVHTARVLPSSAVLRTGHGDFVMLSRDGGAFLPVAVHTGVESDDTIEIRGGIQEGALVASNAQFLLDPSASWSDTLARR
ncbi:MAG TPA: efflux RND transporter periplasmic adaptor subunit [Burkholderiaceae bacterium]|nr:efflux RND transporter periplasmic adaptor subunit [Burkholderiaceae bacterium]